MFGWSGGQWNAHEFLHVTVWLWAYLLDAAIFPDHVKFLIELSVFKSIAY